MSVIFDETNKTAKLEYGAEEINTKLGQINDLEAKKHTHSNQTVIDKLSEVDGQLKYDGNAISGGTSLTEEQITNIGKVSTIEADVTTLETTVGNKVDKVEGKTLTSNDFTNDYKTKLDGLENYTLPTATTDVLGGVKVDGTSMTVDSDGTIHSTANISDETFNTKINEYLNTNPPSAMTDEQVATSVNTGISNDSIDVVAGIKEGSVTKAMLSDNLFEVKYIISNNIGAYSQVKFPIVNYTNYAKDSGDYTYKVSFSITNNYDMTNLRVYGKRAGYTTSVSFNEQLSLPITKNKKTTVSYEVTDNKLIEALTIQNSSGVTGVGIDGTIEDLVLTIDGTKVEFDTPVATNNTSTDEGTVTKEVGKGILSTKEYVDNKINNYEYEIKDYSIAINKLDKEASGHYFKVENNVGSLPLLNFNVSGTNKSGKIVFAMDIETTEDISKIALVTGATSPNNIYFVDYVQISPTRYIATVNIDGEGKNHSYIAVQMRNSNTQASLNMTVYGMELIVNGEKRELSNFTSTYGTVTNLKQDNSTLATTTYVQKIIEGLINPKKIDFELPFPNTVYTVCNDATTSENYYPLSTYIDYLYNGNSHQITFDNGEDCKVIFNNPYSYQQTSDIMNKKTTYKFDSDYWNVKDVTFNNVRIKASIPHKLIKCLTIGDSVTAGAITDLQYWAFCAKFFEKEAIDFNRQSNCMMLGTKQIRSMEVTENGTTRTTLANACGTSSWSLNHWMTEVPSDTKINPFTYKDDDGTVHFSILKWIERYRNYDDEGNKLELGNSNLGTMITSENIDTVQCCTPNVILLNSTHNDYGDALTNFEKIIPIIRAELPDVTIIVGNGMPLLGTWFNDKYSGVDWENRTFDKPNNAWKGSYGTSRIEQLEYWKNAELTKKYDNLYYLPLPVVTPTIEGLEHITVDDGNGKKVKMMIKENQMATIHPGTFAHKNWGFELYSLLKYIFSKDVADTTTNEVTVTLDNTTLSIANGSTSQLTATPSVADTEVTFSSSDETVATVDSTGLVTAVGSGTAYIYAETSTSILPAVCTVTVTE